ncbi:MAG: hypothetical protein Q9162_004202 [Coniocarpon cinnabarinum]
MKQTRMESSSSQELCDPCRVKKIRCGRHGKKPSQTTTLSQSVELLGARFDKVESVIRELQQSFEKLQKEEEERGAPSAPESLHEYLSHDALHPSRDSSLVRASNHQPTGPVTLQSLAQDAQKLCPDLCLENDELGGRVETIAARDTLKAIVDASDDFLAGMTEDVAPEMPILDLVHSMTQSFHNYISPSMPLWTRNGFTRMMNRATSRAGPPNHATVCLVAQRHWNTDVLSRLFHQAAYVARCTGLDSLSSFTRQNSADEDFEESLNVLTCLCTIGSSVSWVSGRQPLFSSTEAAEAALVSMRQYTQVNEPLSAYRKARLSLVKIENRVFAASDPVQAHGQTFIQMYQNKMSLREELRDWWIQCRSKLNSECDSAGIPTENALPTCPCASAELEVRYYTMRVSLAWSLHGIYEEDMDITMDSRACLRLLMDMWNNDSHLGTRECVARLVASYPPVAFYVIFAQIVNNKSDAGFSNTLEHDLFLLQSYAHVVYQTSHLADNNTYAWKLSAFHRSLVQFASEHNQRQYSCSMHPGSSDGMTNDTHSHDGSIFNLGNGDNSLALSTGIAPNEIFDAADPQGYMFSHDRLFDSLQMDLSSTPAEFFAHSDAKDYNLPSDVSS